MIGCAQCRVGGSCVLISLYSMPCRSCRSWTWTPSAASWPSPPAVHNVLATQYKNLYYYIYTVHHLSYRCCRSWTWTPSAASWPSQRGATVRPWGAWAAWCSPCSARGEAPDAVCISLVWVNTSWCSMGCCICGGPGQPGAHWCTHPHANCCPPEVNAAETGAGPDVSYCLLQYSDTLLRSVLAQPVVLSHKTTYRSLNHSS